MTVASPCSSLCKVDDKAICIGCGRSLDEIAGWLGMTDDDKQAVLNRAAERRRLTEKPLP